MSRKKPGGHRSSLAGRKWTGKYWIFCTPIGGVSGMTIIEAILKGERDPWHLAALAQPVVKAIPADIAKSLQGNWREELLFVLRQQVELYRIYREKIAAPSA